MNSPSYLNSENELNLDYPIFVYYLDTRNKPSQRIHEEAANIRNKISYSNVTLWVILSEQPSKIECVYDGDVKYKKNKNIYNQIMNAILSIKDTDVLRSKIRDILLTDIIDEP